jgi:predicted GNAT family N-acyltransferase
VFCGEQGVAPEADRDGHDDEAIQIVAVTDERVLGTCRVLVRSGVGLLGRMAVEPQERGAGIGAALLAAADGAAREAGAERIRLNAQTHALSVYERAGYVREGEEFQEQGIPHVTMERRLA